MRRIVLASSIFLVTLKLSGCAALVTPSSKPTGDPQPPANPVSVLIASKFTSQLVGGPAVSVPASVSNDTANEGVTWTLTAGGVSCAPACGSLTPSKSPSFNASYTPPAAVPAAPNNSPTITATSVADTSKSDRFTFSLAFSPGSFAGSYVYFLRGFGPNGSPIAIAGTLAVDANGNIVGGQLDVNVGGQITTAPSSLAGAYLIDTSFNGMTRGTINVTNFALPGTNSNMGMKFALSADGKRGKVIEYDTSGFLSAGTLLQQDPKALTGAIPAGSFVFGLDSDSSAGARVVEAGQLSLSASGVTGGLVDQSEAGNAAPIYSAAPITPGAATPADASGRGLLTLTVGGNSTRYAYYVVDSTQFALIEIDNGQTFGTVQAGTAHLQKPLTAASVSATIVFQMTGIDTSFGTQNLGSAVAIGVISVAPGNALNLTYDSNDAGTVLTARPASGQIISFDQITGRGVLSVSKGANAGVLNSAAFYLYDTDTGFLIDADPTTPPGTPPDQQVANKAYSGTFSPQAAGPFGNQTLSGNMISLTGASATPQIPEIVTGINASSANGNFAAIADVASLNSQIGDSPSRTFSEDYQLLDSTLGHGSMTLPPGYFGDFDLNQSAPATFYLIGPNQFVLIGTLSGVNSGVIFADPE
jgi:hypothetical protein